MWCVNPLYETKECTVCYENDADVCCKRCTKWAHDSCLRKWGQRCKHNVPTCPTCRTLVFLPKKRTNTKWIALHRNPLLRDVWRHSRKEERVEK